MEKYAYVVSVRLDTYDPENYFVFTDYEAAERAIFSLIQDNEDNLYDWASDDLGNIYYWFTEKGTYRIERLPLM